MNNRVEYYVKRLNEIKASLGDKYQKDCFLIDNVIAFIESGATEEAAPVPVMKKKITEQQAKEILRESGLFPEETIEKDKGLINTILKYSTVEDLEKVVSAMARKEDLSNPTAYLIGAITKKKK